MKSALAMSFCLFTGALKHRFWHVADDLPKNISIGIRRFPIINDSQPSFLRKAVIPAFAGKTKGMAELAVNRKITRHNFVEQNGETALLPMASMAYA